VNQPDMKRSITASDLPKSEIGTASERKFSMNSKTLELIRWVTLEIALTF
jgi:hypothetical protein